MLKLYSKYLWWNTELQTSIGMCLKRTWYALVYLEAQEKIRLLPHHCGTSAMKLHKKIKLRNGTGRLTRLREARHLLDRLGTWSLTITEGASAVGCFKSAVVDSEVLLLSLLSLDFRDGSLVLVGSFAFVCSMRDWASFFRSSCFAILSNIFITISSFFSSRVCRKISKNSLLSIRETDASKPQI